MFSLLQTSVREIPFHHFAADEFLEADIAENLLGFCEQTNEWKLRKEDDFYETYDLSLKHIKLPRHLEDLRSKSTIEWLAGLVSTQFGNQVDPTKVDISLQKMITGQRIGIHTDFGPVGQNYRILVQLNRGWSSANGGLLLLLESDRGVEPSDHDRFYLPNHRSALAFEISQASFHAVSEVFTGARFTLSYSFYRR